MKKICPKSFYIQINHLFCKPEKKIFQIVQQLFKNGTQNKKFKFINNFLKMEANLGFLKAIPYIIFHWIYF
ncbi:unnamed protein product [Blepharisma stoltei]|uniref:Uncharacterized protein n=1 Tax=Blepharisma stoltei TaxID=1481888 RepID=A0AAU9J626_9CILI|nr:unnamed protein product [Blepharisma stoltei]